MGGFWDIFFYLSLGMILSNFLSHLYPFEHILLDARGAATSLLKLNYLPYHLGHLVDRGPFPPSPVKNIKPVRFLKFTGIKIFQN